MTDYSETSLIKGKIIYKRQGVPSAIFETQKISGGIVANDTVTISSKPYTSESSTTSKTIFQGRIDDTDLKDLQNITVLSKLEEVEIARPQGTYLGYAEAVAGRVVNDLIDNSKLSHLSCSKSSGDITIRPNGDDTIVGWEEGDAESDPDSYLYNEVNDQGDTDYIKESLDTATTYICDLENHSLSSTYNYSIYKVTVRTKGDKGAAAGTDLPCIYFYDGVSWHQGNVVSGYSNGSFTWDEQDFTDLRVSQDEIDNFQVKIYNPVPSGIADIKVSQIEVIVYYHYYPDLQKSSTKISIDTDGENSLKKILDAIALNTLWTWYIDVNYDLHFNDGTTSSGTTISSSDDIQNIKGKKQIKQYQKVILYGGFAGSTQLVSSSGSGEPVYEGTFMNVANQTTLNNLAAKILTILQSNPLELELDYINSTKGLFQVGELITIESGISFSNSTYDIPAGDYTINRIDYFINRDGYHKLRLYIISELLIEQIKILEGKKEITQVSTLVYDAHTGLNQLSTATGGEINYGSNIGIGEDIYSGKSGVTLQFHGIKAGSSKVTASLVSEDVEIDVVEAEIDHDLLKNYSEGEHRTINDSGTGATDLWSANKINTAKEDAFSKNSAFNKNFGTGSGEVCQGNDTRIGKAYYIEDKEIDVAGIATDKILKYDGTKWAIANDLTGAGSTTLDEAFDNGKVIDGANSEANAFQVGEVDDKIKVWHDGNDAYIKNADDGNLIFQAPDGYIYIDPLYHFGIRPSGQTTYWRRYANIDDDIAEYDSGSTTTSERGLIGKDGIGTARPMLQIYTNDLWTDDGGVSEYSVVDDLQLLRELETYEKEKAPCPEFPDRKQKVFDMNSLPWIKAHPDVAALPNDSNQKRYSIPTGSKIGYLLSVMRELLIEIDNLKARIEILEGG